MQLSVGLHLTVKEKNHTRLEWLCIFIVISIISREITLGEAHSILLHVCLTWEKQVASSKTWHCKSLWHVQYMPGGNHLRKHKHKFVTYHFNDSP